MNSSTLVLPYLHHTPTLAAPPVALGEGTAIVGRATVGKGAHFGTLAMIRADGHFVTVGDDFWFGPRSAVHIAHAMLPTIIGHNVTVGTNSTVHACTVGDDCVVEDNVVVLDGSVVGEGCVIGAGSVVVPRSELPSGHWCEGVPAKPVRPVTKEQLAAARARVRGLMLASRSLPMQGDGFQASPQNFFAPTASSRGRIHLEADASVWFSCELDASKHDITAGGGSNIQDNTVVLAQEGPVHIGSLVTIGHNVTIQSAHIGNRCLIGMGAVLAPGTIVEDDVLVAAGTVTLPGQRLTSGFMWAGRPARQLGALDEGKRKIIQYSATHYVDYNRDFLRTSLP